MHNKFCSEQLLFISSLWIIRYIARILTFYADIPLVISNAGNVLFQLMLKLKSQQEFILNILRTSNHIFSSF